MADVDAQLLRVEPRGDQGARSTVTRLVWCQRLVPLSRLDLALSSARAGLRRAEPSTAGVGLYLDLPHFRIVVPAAADVDHAGIEVNVAPAQPADHVEQVERVWIVDGE